MFYWLTSNFWTMAQQFIVIRNMPTPGSEAALAREARMAKKRQRKDVEEPEPNSATIVLEEPKKTQRPQPVSKTRAKKSGGKKK
jgi:YidC/Oxa1 family membrane protein insertase